MAAPAAGEPNLPPQSSDVQLIDIERRSIIPDSVDDDPTIFQLTKSKTPHPPPPAPVTSSLGKRRKSKPKRYGGASTDVERTHSPSSFKIVVCDPSSNCLSFEKENSATKSLKSPVQTLPAMIRAGEVQASLGTEYPSCIRLMVKSHVSTGFWMGLPHLFCKMFLPKTDTAMVVEDEDGEESHIRYIANKTGLSAGWKKFVVAHNLLEGDVLIFQLVETCKFKVYIIRANDLNEVDGALGLLNLEAHEEQTTPDNTETDPTSPKTNRTKRRKSLPLIVVQKKHKLSTPPSQMDHSGNDSEEVGSEVLEGSRPSKPQLPFQELKTFEDFRIVVNGLCIDSELPEEVRMDYYKLCISRKEVLHDALPESLYYKLVAGMIGETVNISNEIKNCNITTKKEEYDVWDNSLKSFELLRMKVGFLRDKISNLTRIAFESEGRYDIEKYNEAKNEQKRINDEIVRLTAKLVEMEEGSRNFQNVVEGLKEKAERHVMKFKEEVDAPW